MKIFLNLFAQNLLVRLCVSSRYRECRHLPDLFPSLARASARRAGASARRAGALARHAGALARRAGVLARRASEDSPARTPTPLQRFSMRDCPASRPVMRQRWSRLLFLHWPVDPEWIRSRLPAGLHVDLFDNRGWLGVVPFAMERVHPVGLPPLPWISWFLELNVRTYVHDDAGRPGVWFFSLDCNQPLAVEVARRFFHLPYYHARIHAACEDGQTIYTSQRRGSKNKSTFRYRSPVRAEPVPEHSLEWFLVERYLLFTTDRIGQIRSGRVHHTPYRIEVADCAEWSLEPIIEDGFGCIQGPPASMLVAEPVDVRIFPLV